MDNFVLKGKANTVFRLIRLMAKGEKAEKTEKIERRINKKSFWQYHISAN